MKYHLALPDLSGHDPAFPKELRLEGYKRVRQDPGLDAWRDTTALFTRIGVPGECDGKLEALGGSLGKLLAAGVIHVDLNGFAFKEMPSFTATGGEVHGDTTDSARINWAIAKFASFFFGTLQRVYSPAGRSVLDAIYQPMPNKVRHDPPSLRN